MSRNILWGSLLSANTFLFLLNASIALQLGEHWALEAVGAIVSAYAAALCIDMLWSD